MIKGIFKESGVLSKILQLIVVLIFVLLSTLLIVGLVTNNDMTNMHNLKIMQLIQSVGMFVVPPLALAFLWSEKPLHYLQLTTKLKLSSILLVVVLMGVAIPIINLITSLNQQIALPDFLAPVEAWMKNSEEQAAVLTEKMLNIHSFNELLFNIFLIAMIPALGEELFSGELFKNTYPMAKCNLGDMDSSICVQRYTFTILRIFSPHAARRFFWLFTCLER